jgi:hypothetical protein
VMKFTKMKTRTMMMQIKITWITTCNSIPTFS